MADIFKITRWGDRHHPAILDIIRILLGLFLLLKGVDFFKNLAYLRWMIGELNWVHLSPGLITAIMYYVTFIHLVGGILIMLGLLTRWCSLLQLPIIVGSLFVINIFKTPINSDLWLSVFSGILLVLFILMGSGPISLDNLLSDKKS